ncbi:MAG: hypothetical protein HFI30_00995 [Lachnospiraceae bacterium]|jgi:CDP-glycerol glycerophosphotransferase (TagB/SpsB family)|nr:hypothetical protein [Lachnospiraceae bacterium]
MDIMDYAIEQGKHITGNRELDCQAWADFEKETLQKKIILFGTGAACGYYFERYGDSKRLAGVVDNDSKKQGVQVDELIPEAFGLKAGETKIRDISLLDACKPNEIVVLITSINYYEAIASQLRQAGITNCFVQLIMEANRRKGLCKGTDEKAEEGLLKKRFAQECCQKEKLDKKKIFFRAFGDYADHGKYITEALLKVRRDLDLVWAVEHLETEVPEGVRKVYAGNWKRFIYEMETSGVWVLDLPVFEYIIKRPGQLYIQTKHWSSITLKKFYLDVAAFQTEPEKVRSWKREKELIDHIITGSDFDTESCRRGFEFTGQILQYGSPRSDGLFCETENREKVYQHFHLDRKKKAALYAPTYRFNKALGKNVHESRNIDLDFEQVKKALERRFGGEWYILVRLHPSVSDALEETEKPYFVIDTSKYGDSQELISASDILISDYSSIMFEAAFVKKPVFLFATDLQDYIANEYELLIPYHELPFPVAESNEELEQNILELNLESYKENVESFLDRYGVHEDGHASDRTAAFISDWIQKNEVKECRLYQS